MKIKVWIHISDNGDGSASAEFFRTEAEANKAFDENIESGGASLNDTGYYEIIDTDDFDETDEVPFTWPDEDDLEP